MSIPAPFDMELDDFIAGEDGVPDVDDVFAKPFAVMHDEMLRYAPEDLLPDMDEAALPSLVAPGVVMRDVPCGIMMYGPDGGPIGGYLSSDVGLDPDWRGRGLGAELVIERCLRSGENPVSNLDSASYSNAGVATFRAAWRRVRTHPEETAARVARLRRAGHAIDDQG